MALHQQHPRLEVGTTKIKVYSISKEMLRFGLWPASSSKLFELNICYFIKEIDFIFIANLASIAYDHFLWPFAAPHCDGRQANA